MENDDLPPPPPVNNHHIKLPAFWPNNIISWFAMAEGQLVLRNVNDEHIRYYNVLTALPEATINFVADFVEAPLPACPLTPTHSCRPDFSRRTSSQTIRR
jgi:hypothetical protein